MRIYPGNVISSHIPYGHFGSGILFIFVKLWSLLQHPLSDQINIIGWTYFTRHTFSKNVFASGEMIPTPYESILHPPRGPQVPYRPKTALNIPVLLDCCPIDPFKGCPIDLIQCMYIYIYIYAYTRTQLHKDRIGPVIWCNAFIIADRRLRTGWRFGGSTTNRPTCLFWSIWDLGALGGCKIHPQGVGIISPLADTFLKNMFVCETC